MQARVLQTPMVHRTPESRSPLDVAPVTRGRCAVPMLRRVNRVRAVVSAPKEEVQ